MRGYILLLLAMLISLNASAATSRQALRDSLPPTARARPLGRLEATTNLDLELSLPLRNREALSNLVQQLYNPASPNYRHFLTPEQFASQFGPEEADYQALANFARSRGFAVTGTSPNRTILNVRARATDIERTFGVSLRHYQHPFENRQFFAADSAPSLDLSVPMLAVNGLDNYALPRPMNLDVAKFRKNARPLGTALAEAALSAANGTEPTPYATGSGPRGNFLGKDFRLAYAPGVMRTGAGEAVGLLQFDSYYPGDIAAYESLAGLPSVPITNVLLAGTGIPSGNNIEVALDIDMTISMAPGLSRVIVYIGGGINGGNTMLNRMATDNLARQLSSSWGFGNQTDATREQIYLQFAAQGQCMFQASGDDGAYSGSVSPPSDDALLTVVGGTSLTTGPGGQWASETAWAGSGGGFSSTYPIPAWQQGISMTANHGSTTKRNIPDVSALSDGLVWLIANNGEEAAIGGTSAAAPMWAGFAALVNEEAAATGKAPVGFLNPTLSLIGLSGSYNAAFHDITNGNNFNSSSLTNFPAVAGYDLVTGWGSPTGSNLIAALLSPNDPLIILPPTNIVLTSPAGTSLPAYPANLAVMTLGGPLNWALSNNAPWVAASPSSGTVTSNSSTLITLQFATNASNLPAGTYTALLQFTNLNDGLVQMRQFILQLVAPPAITSQPASVTVAPGANAHFSVGTASNAQLFFQWQFNGTNLTNGGRIFGADSPALVVTHAGSNDAGNYSVVVSNIVSVTNSSNALLTISPTAPGANFSTVYEFTGGIDGGNPNGLSMATDGTLYGTTQNGGSNSSGSVFKLPPGGMPTNLYSFTGGTDGGHPQAALAAGADGTWYGTAFDGGDTDNGAIFKISTNGAFTRLVSLDPTNGDLPYAGLTPSWDGNFYGTTYQGGSAGYGTVFQMSSNGSLTTLFNFNGGANGGLVRGTVIQAADTALYGTTFKGGAFNAGSVYRVSTNGLLTTLFSFNGTNGGNPYAGLVQDDTGNFVGVSSTGGAFSNGAIFRLTPSGAFTNIYSFNGTNDGSRPVGGLVQAVDGNLYGTTSTGGAYGYGTAFRLTPNGAISNLIQFDGFNGANPASTLLATRDGFLYGSTQNGGASGAGMLFRIDLNTGPLQITAQPVSQTVYSGSTIYLSVAVSGSQPVTYQWLMNGTNLVDGGSVNGSATRVLTIANAGIGNAAIYSVVASNSSGAVTSDSATVQIVVSPPIFTQQPVSQTLAPGATAVFSASAIGSQPLTYQWRKNGLNLSDGGNISGAHSPALTVANLIETDSGNYSLLASNPITTAASSNAVLNVIPTSASGTRFTSIHWFTNGSDGSTPSVLTLGNDGNLYGTTPLGGSFHRGTVFRVDTNGNYLTVAQFTNNGMWPLGGVVQGLDGNFYGTTRFGGASGVGSVYRMTAGGVLTTLYSFAGGADGYTPIAPLIRGPDGAFYGSTQSGGNFSQGNIFRIDTNGVIANLYSFTGGLDGGQPTNALLAAPDGSFYGVTQNGGSLGYGTVFRLTPAGDFSAVYTFQNIGSSPPLIDGKSPNGPLVFGDDGSLYGTTRRLTFRTLEFYGNVFKLSTNGALSPLYAFNTSDGHFSAAGVIRGPDGNYYGTAEFGGTVNNNGVVFRITPGGAMTTLVNFDGSDEGAHPQTPLTAGADGNLYGTTSTGGPGGYGSIYRLSFTSAPQIITPPAPVSTYVGASANFYVAVSGSQPISYQWRKNGTNVANGQNVAGGSARFLTLSNLTTNDAGSYSVVVSNSQGSVTSAPALLTVQSAGPQITSSPTKLTMLPGATASFAVGASGNQPLVYQWLKNSNNLADGGSISGAHLPTLVISNVGPADAGFYSAIVSNSVGSTPSASAQLTVVSVTTNNATLSRIYSFTGGNDGANPNGLAQAPNGSIFGSTRNGGLNGAGILFLVNSNLGLSNLHTFSGGSDGANPAAAMTVGLDGGLYGTTYAGGDYQVGTIYRLAANGALTNLASFGGGPEGAFPQAPLTLAPDGNFYGTTYGGGNTFFGAIYHATTNGTLNGVLSFDGSDTNGIQPTAGLVRGPDGNYYGTTSAGGIGGGGTLFRISTNGQITIILSFGSPGAGMSPNGIVQGEDGNFYGTTSAGGSFNTGVVYRASTSGDFTILYSFTAVVNSTNADGANPSAELVKGADGNFYGTTANGGRYGNGTAFMITPAGALTTLAWFDGFNGAHPASALLPASDGNFYGTTVTGGLNGVGAIFKLGVQQQPLLRVTQGIGFGFAITWNAVVGRTYQLQYSTSLAPGNWQNLGSPFVATGNPMTTIDIAPTDQRRFYRIQALP